MQNINILSRRAFFDRSFKIGLGVALSTLADIPWVMKRALAEGTIGVPGPDGKVKKLLFVFLRGANDALNSVIPVGDSAYNATNRPNILIPKDPTAGFDYGASGPCFDPTQYLDVGGTTRGAANATFSYGYAIRAGNGFAALHPSLKFLAPVYNAGELAFVHRVAYPKQSRSHFDSQHYWETGNPNNQLVKDGIFYRAMVESGLANSAPLTGVSVASALPLSLRGSAAAMTNLTDPTRYNLLGIPNNTAGNAKADSFLSAANACPFPDKKNRELLSLQYQNMANTLQIFAGIDFSESGNSFVDDVSTDNDAPYYLFPTSNAKNGGYAAHGSDPNKYVVDTNAYGFFTNLKAAALVLNKTDAIVAGVEFDGFDTHNNQVGATPIIGQHANLLRRIGWAMYAIRKYFTLHADKAKWENLVVITLSEFGRTTVQNNSFGTDHAEAGVMFVAGGAIKGYGKGNSSGIFGCHPGDPVHWIDGPANQAGGVDGSMFAVNDRYLKRGYDYRSVLGKLIRDHLGATQTQLNRIIPGYGVAGEHLLAGGTSSVDGTPIMGEPNVV
jgi:uncharacterized protein (DUF1501 family)